MLALGVLLEQMRSNPGNVRYADACRIATACFGAPRQRGTSHRVWKMPWAGDPRVNLQQDKGGKAKAYQIQQLLRAVDRWYAEQAKKGTEAKQARPRPEVRGQGEGKRKGRRRS